MSDYVRVRIGIVGNNEDGCVSPDSALGLGIDVPGLTDNTAGNAAQFGADNGDKNIKAFAYVFIR